jgi:hypothetical protein
VPSALSPMPAPLILVGKSIQNLTEFRNYSNSGPFQLQNFQRNFIFLIIKCVPANLEHVPSGLESSPSIDSSSFMNRKMFPHFVFSWPAKMTSTRLPQPVDPMIINCMDMGIIPGKVLASPI